VTAAYVDLSALVKLAIHEHMVSSDLSTLEISRAAFRQRGQDGLVHAKAALLPINLDAARAAGLATASP
jgi:hypothetical protein